MQKLAASHGRAWRGDSLWATWCKLYFASFGTHDYLRLDANKVDVIAAGLKSGGQICQLPLSS
eukprot:4117777-Amphidinium_carterae.1